MNDFRHAYRTLVKTPGFTLVILLTLALGIGANSALFSVLSATLLKPLPYPESELLVELQEANKQSHRMSVSYPNFLDWKDRQTSFSYLTLFKPFATNLRQTEGTVRVPSLLVDHDFFRVLGQRPAQGRDFLPTDDTLASAAVVMVSHEAWKRRFSSDPTLVGQQVTLAGRTATVVGILPETFRFFREAEFFLPIAPFAEETYLRMRENHNDCYGLARLRPGLALAVARAETETLGKQLEADYPKSNTGLSIQVTPLQERLGGGSRTQLYLLFGAVGMVLLIACVNVANMLLSRAASRGREIAIRSALGAGRARLVRQLLSESLLLAVGGGVLGLVVGQWLYRLLDALVPWELRTLGVHQPGGELDWRIACFTVAVTALTGLAFGLVPALQLSRTSPIEAMRERAPGSQQKLGRFRLADLLVVSEIALAAMLLIGAGLLLQNLQKLRDAELGFEPAHLITVKIANPNHRLDGDVVRFQAFYEGIAQSLRELPGVTAVGLTNRLPFDYSNASMQFHVHDRPVPAAGDFPIVSQRTVTPEFFETTGLRVLQGRVFVPSDKRPDFPKGKPDMAAVLKALRDFRMEGLATQSFVQRYWPGENPLGKILRLGTPDLPFGWIEIVGVVADARLAAADQGSFEEIFLPFRQWCPPVDYGLVIRATGQPAQLLPTVRDLIQTHCKDEPYYNLTLQTEQIDRTLAARSFNSGLFAFFASVALALALVGIYGVLAFTISRRTRDIGIRIALGATHRQVLEEILGRGLRFILPGLALGLFGAWGLSRWVGSRVPEFSSPDPLIQAVAALLLGFAALAACWFPARRATRINPVEALRTE